METSSPSVPDLAHPEVSKAIFEHQIYITADPLTPDAQADNSITTNEDSFRVEETTKEVLLEEDQSSVANRQYNEESTIANDCAFPETPIILTNENEAYVNQLKEEESEIQTKQSNIDSLKAQFAEVVLQNKKLYNELIELKGNIRVFCRCRPLSAAEISSGATSAVDFDLSHDTDLHVTSDSSKKSFKFDRVFTPDSTQETVFAETKPIITSVLDGYNVCIFAYGQTGSGKTFTMEGTPENRGVNYRAVEELFKIYQDRSTFMKFAISVSMLEVYKEKIRDLLADGNSKTLEVKQTQDGSQEVPGLVEPEVTTTEEVWSWLKTGSKARSVGSTGGNEFSSRSHCLLRVTVKSENLVSGVKTKSHLWLVDLAGSERVSKTEVEGERMKESQFINKSLSALGDVISSLAAKNGHVPYRNSKLTHILQSSLGGDCKTLMFMQISPNSDDANETVCSLNFATRVRGIENGPAKRHVDVSENKQIMEKLKEAEREVIKLKETVKLLDHRLAAKESVIKVIQEKRRSEKECAFEKPPLAPKRSPLQKITNLPSPVTFPANAGEIIKPFRKENSSRVLMPPRRASVATYSAAAEGSQVPRRRTSLAAIPQNTLHRAVMQPRRASVATNPAMIPRRRVSGTISENSSRTLAQPILPRRRASVAVLPPKSSSRTLTQPMVPRRVSVAVLQPDNSRRALVHPTRASMTQVVPRRRASMSIVRPDSSGLATPKQRPSMIPRPPPRKSNLFTMMPDFGPPVSDAASSSKYASPIRESAKGKRPMFALQRKPLLWSPMKRLDETKRKSLMLPRRVIN